MIQADLKSVAMGRTPQVGIPRTQICVGARSMVRQAKSPAQLTMRGKPMALGFWGALGLVIVAKLCQPTRGRSTRHTAVPTMGVV
jgi:DMSO/TMAO reductase YedYZ molybdopterin-dependent catalytic subunit